MTAGSTEPLPTFTGGSNDDYTSADVASMKKQAATIKKEISSLRADLRHHRLSSYSVRRNILARIRKAEQTYNTLLQNLHIAEKVVSGELYRKKLQKIKGGVDVRVEISLDGIYYSNPAPDIKPNKIIYVRCIISDAHRGVSGSGIPITHEMAHLTWVAGKGYVAQDKIPKGGHNVWFVSHPLVIIRKFKSPASKTNQNFLVNVDLYEPKTGGF
jgi:hypothetical protein